MKPLLCVGLDFESCFHFRSGSSLAKYLSQDPFQSDVSSFIFEMHYKANPVCPTLRYDATICNVKQSRIKTEQASDRSSYKLFQQTEFFLFGSIVVVLITYLKKKQAAVLQQSYFTVIGFRAMRPAM